MPLDAICISALANELDNAVVGAKIEKIQQPAKDLLLFSLRGRSGALKLLINAGNGCARIHLTEQSFENPAEPPMFCMLMRKHLTGARILSVEQPEYERMLILEVESRNEMGDTAKRSIIVEMIGRSSNVILCDSEGRIIDCLRRMDFAGDELRRLLPGMIYRLPPKQPKPLLLETTLEQLKLMADSADRDEDVDRWLMAHYSGLSPLICREIAYMAGYSFDKLTDAVDEFIDTAVSGNTVPAVIELDGKPADFSFMPICQYGAAAKLIKYDSFSEMLDSFYSERDKAEIRRRKSRQLMHDVKQARDRLAKKLANQREELRRTDGMKDVRKTAELITANLYRIKKGQGDLECEDYYQDDCPTVRIPLDRLKTPQQNAAALFKEYNKLRGAKLHLTELIDRGDVQLDYLNSVLDEIERAQSEKDLSDIRAELTQTGVLRKTKGEKASKLKTQAPLHYIAEDGSDIFVGRSNIQNEELTFKLARRTDYWLHAQKFHGSHVIIRCDGLEPSDRTIEQAAELAAFYSQGRGAGKVPVDYTMVRFVKKKPGGMPGMVFYTDYKTLLAEPKESGMKK